MAAAGFMPAALIVATALTPAVLVTSTRYSMERVDSFAPIDPPAPSDALRTTRRDAEWAALGTVTVRTAVAELSAIAVTALLRQVLAVVVAEEPPKRMLLAEAL